MRHNLLALCIILGLGVLGFASDKDTKVPAVLNFKMKDIDGQEISLSKYQGKVILFVNVASRCGYTPQYEQLQALHEKYGKEGLVIIGVPANEFGAQEPGTNSQIKDFCDKEYGVKFPMMAKVVVKGKGICPLYEHLTSKKTNPEFGGEIKWNFTKFLISRKGEIVNRFTYTTRPDAAQVLQAIEAELKK